MADRAIVLGAEHDERLHAALGEVLAALGAVVVRRAHGMAGSQEVDQLDVELDGERLHVETETYCGVTIAGPAALVDRVAALVRERYPGP